MGKYTKEQYTQFVKTMSDENWKLIRTKMEERMPEVKKWDEDLFRSYSLRVVTAGSRKEDLN